MNILNYLIIGFCVISILLVLFFALRTRHFIKSLIISATTGLSVMLILHFTSNFTGFEFNITPISLITSSVFGLPGVVAIVLTKMILGV